MEPKDIDGIMNDIVIVGELVGGKAIAEQKVDALEARVGHVANSIAHLSASSGVLFVTWHDPLWTQGDGAFMDSVIKLAGGTNIFSDVAGDAQVDIELAVTRNPQVIIVAGSMGSDTMSYDYIIAADSLFKATDAYKNDKVMLLDGDLATRPSHRLVDTLELVAKFLYPEIFS
jgi:iron complex transport system substrate-binding protein